MRCHLDVNGQQKAWTGWSVVKKTSDTASTCDGQYGLALGSCNVMYVGEFMHLQFPST